MKLSGKIVPQSMPMTDSEAQALDENAGETDSNQLRSPARQPAGRVPRIPTVVQAVADDLKKRVLDGEFEPGSQLRENDLLEDYRIARHGIRSALHALAHEGLLRHQPHRGVFVPEASTEEIADVLTARFGIESGAIRLIVDREADKKGLVQALDELEAVPEDASWSELLGADFAVHRAIVDAVGSPRMSRVHESLIGESALFLAFYGPKDHQRSIIRPGHRRLVEHILGSDIEGAQELLSADLQQGLAAAGAAQDGTSAGY